MSATSSNRWSLFELSATYYQDSDCNDLADPGQELKLTAESNGAGQFLTLSTTRWAVSGPTELQALLADFIGRGAGLPLEQAPTPPAAVLTVEGFSPEQPAAPLGGLEAWAQGVEPEPTLVAVVKEPAAAPPAKRAGGGMSRSGEPLRLWTAQEDEQLKADYGTRPNKELAAALNRSEKSIIQRAGKFGLKKVAQLPVPKAVATAEPIVIPRAVAPAKEAEISPDSSGLTGKLEAKLLKTVDRLGLLKLVDMPEEEAQQALKLLSDNRGKLAWVPGGARLLERLSGHFSMPTSGNSMTMEGSRARA